MANLVGGGEDVLPRRHDAIDAKRRREARVECNESNVNKSVEVTK